MIPEEFDQFLVRWAAEAEKFKKQPGFISTQLHQGIGESGTFINSAIWETVAHFKEQLLRLWIQRIVCLLTHPGYSTSDL